MNMLVPHRRNPSRRRQAPKRYEDEKFVSGRIDQYTRGYEGRDSNWKAKAEDAENYYRHMSGRKIYQIHYNLKGKYRFQLRDFPESLLELASIWRDLDMVLPSAIVSQIGSFLAFSNTDQALLEDDDGFVAADESEDEVIEESEDSYCGECWCSADETEEEDDYDSDELYDSD